MGSAAQCDLASQEDDPDEADADVSAVGADQREEAERKPLRHGTAPAMAMP
jgi:hypothetical protein